MQWICDDEIAGTKDANYITAFVNSTPIVYLVSPLTDINPVGVSFGYKRCI